MVTASRDYVLRAADQRTGAQDLTHREKGPRLCSRPFFVDERHRQCMLSEATGQSIPAEHDGQMNRVDVNVHLPFIFAAHVGDRGLAT